MKFWKKHREEMRRRRMRENLEDALVQLERVDTEYQMATEECHVEQLIYQRAALMCRCRVILRKLREDRKQCLSG